MIPSFDEAERRFTALDRNGRRRKSTNDLACHSRAGGYLVGTIRPLGALLIPLAREGWGTNNKIALRSARRWRVGPGNRTPIMDRETAVEIDKRICLALDRLWQLG